jgi:ATP-dependent Clp protease ATP-binding subunit ClpA
MFERFTKDARRVVLGAQEEARALRHREIGSEHLLLAVLAADAGAATQVLRDAGLSADSARTLVAELGSRSSFSGAPDPDALATIGIDLDAVRSSVEETFGAGALEGTKAARARVRGHRGHLPFTRSAKKALELSLREALALGHRHIGVEHILLGLLRDNAAQANTVIVEAGADPASIRRALLDKIAA